MDLTTEHGGPGRPGWPAQGYETVPLLTAGTVGGANGSSAAVLRRRTARPSRRAVVYVHCLDDSFVPADLAGWYTDRGFHFYAADLRTMSGGGPGTPDPGRAAEAVGAYFACLDAAITHLRNADAIDTVVVSAHAAGALFAALWCHARRGSQPVDALVLTRPELGAARPWPARVAAREDGASAHPSPLVAGAQRRLRRGLEIACPVLVMCPAVQGHGPGAAGGLGALGILGALGALGTLAGRRATIRLGEHVTWLTLDGGLPGQAPAAAQRRRFLDELGRWLSAYLSGQIRDQLLLSGRYWTDTVTIGYPVAPLGSGGASAAVWV
jgi:Serine aminopeptidase, S33